MYISVQYLKHESFWLTYTNIYTNLYEYLKNEYYTIKRSQQKEKNVMRTHTVTPSAHHTFSG